MKICTGKSHFFYYRTNISGTLYEDLNKLYTADSERWRSTAQKITRCCSSMAKFLIPHLVDNDVPQ